MQCLCRKCIRESVQHRPDSYELDGPPRALARPRFGNKKVYDSQSHLKIANSISLKNQHEEHELFDGPLHLDVTFFMPIPLQGKKVREKKMNNVWHTSRPDIDNLIKMIGDVCNAILYSDDRAIASISARKIYDTHARTEFNITELNKYECLNEEKE